MFLRGLALLSVIAGQQVFAASIYSFSGQIDEVLTLSGVPPTRYDYLGLVAGAPVVVQILLDADAPGQYVMEGVTNELPFVSITDNGMNIYQTWTRHAALLTTSIAALASNQSGYLYRKTIVSGSFFDDNNYNEGSISVGNGIHLSRKTAFGDTSAFVENWQVGDTIDLDILYGFDIGIGYFGALTLTSISEPMPAMSEVPVPGAGILFTSCLAGLGGWRRMRSA